MSEFNGCYKAKIPPPIFLTAYFVFCTNFFHASTLANGNRN